MHVIGADHESLMELVGVVSATRTAHQTLAKNSERVRQQLDAGVTQICCRELLRASATCYNQQCAMVLCTVEIERLAADASLQKLVKTNEVRVFS